MGIRGKIAGRYLFSGKSGSVIGWISGISVAGIAVGTAALIVILSVYNGFDSMIRENLKETDPDFLVLPAQGKTFDCSTPDFGRVAALDGVTAAYGVVEETVAAYYNGRQAIARVRGLQDAWQCSVSSPLAASLGIRTSLLEMLDLYFPSKDGAFSMMNPEAALESISMRPKSIVGMEDEVVVIPIGKARELLHWGEAVSSFEIRCDAGPGPSIKEIRSILGDGFEVLDRNMQQPALYKMMRYEKAAIFLILLFVVLIVAFNIYGSLSMLIIEKKQDRDTLRSMGAAPAVIRGIFRTEGLMITGLGAAIGLVAGLVLVFVQQRFGLISMPGNGLAEAYPVRLKIADVLLTLAGVGLIGALISETGIKNIDRKDED